MPYRHSLRHELGMTWVGEREMDKDPFCWAFAKTEKLVEEHRIGQWTKSRPQLLALIEDLIQRSNGLERSTWRVLVRHQGDMLALACRLSILRGLWSSIRGEAPKSWLGPWRRAGTSSVHKASWLNLIQTHTLARWICLGFFQSCWIRPFATWETPWLYFWLLWKKQALPALPCYSVNCSFSNQWNLEAWGKKELLHGHLFTPVSSRHQENCLSLFDMLLDIRTGSQHFLPQAPAPKVTLVGNEDIGVCCVPVANAGSGM